jgi:hypothetical protein
MAAFQKYLGVLVKMSGGRPYFSAPVAWYKKPSAMPAAVRARTEAFTAAVPACRAESKSKHGYAFGVSKFNECLAHALKR